MSYDPFWGASTPFSGTEVYSDAGFSPVGGDYFSSMYIPDDAWMPSVQNYAPVVDAEIDPIGFMDKLAAGNYGDAFGSLVDDLGGAKNLLSLGLGGLSLWGNYQANKDKTKLQQQQFDQTLEFNEKQLERNSNTDLAKVEAMMNLLNQRGRAQLDPRRYAEIVASGQVPIETMSQPVKLAAGGQFVGGGGLGRVQGLLRGGTSGQADAINARLSDGEYVIDADTVAALGDGNTEAGAKQLDRMREQIRRHKRSASPKNIPPAAKSPLAYLAGSKR